MKENSFLPLYRDLYSDVVNQVLLMNLVARQIWVEDEPARECFKKIHKGYIALASKKGMIELIGNKSFNYLFPDIGEEADDLFLDKLDKRYGTNNKLHELFPRSINSLSPISVALENEPIFMRMAIINILKDLFKILDEDKPIQSLYAGLLGAWQVVFLNTVFEGVKCIKNTYGYSYQNLYMCLYHFDLVYENLIAEYLEKAQIESGEAEGAIEGKKVSDDKKREMLQEVATWVRRTTRMYNCNFCRSKVFADIALGNDNQQIINNGASWLSINFHDNKLERLVVEDNKEDFRLYSDEICKRLKGWLHDTWSAAHKNMTYDDGLLHDEYNNYRADMEKNEIVEIKKLTKIFTKIDSISTLCYAILSFDFCEGIRAQETQNDAVKHVEEQYHRIPDKPFLTKGVNKQLWEFGKRIKAKDYSQIKIKQVDVLKQRLKSDREFFPYPLFGFSTIPTDEHSKVADMEKSPDEVEKGLTRP